MSNPKTTPKRSFSTGSTSSIIRFKIQPPSTTGDDGSPTESVAKDMQRVFALMHDERPLVAQDLYLDVQKRLEAHNPEIVEEVESSSSPARKGKRNWLRKGGGQSSKAILKAAKETAMQKERDYATAKTAIEDEKEELELLMKKAASFREVIQNLKETSDWTLAQNLFGISTHYRRENDGSLSVKMAGELSGLPLFEPVAVLREIDLHYLWAPAVTSSQTIAHLDKVDTVGWFMVGLPNFGLARDGVFRAAGCDCTMEDGSIYMVGQGINDTPPGKPKQKETWLTTDPILETLEIPVAPSRMGSGRLTIRKFEARVEVLAPDRCNMVILANTDPNLAFVPQPLLEFVMKKLCGFLLHKMKKASLKVIKDPVSNLHAQRMREDAAFYRDWLLPKFEAHAQAKGWELPHVAAFNLTDDQQVEADQLMERTVGKTHSFSEYENTKPVRSEMSAHSLPGFLKSAEDDGINDESDDNKSVGNISEISSLSGKSSSSVWKNNPIATYLRDVEAKAQERKAQKVLQARLKARKRLQPKARPASSHQRLKELKMRKRERARAFSSDGMVMPSSLQPVDENSDVKDNPHQPTRTPRSKGSNFLHLDGYDKRKRPVVLAVLLLLLSLLLHLDKKILPLLSNVGKPWWFMLLADTFVFVYIAACGVCHFLLSDALLIYVFEEFELGMKSGVDTRHFYRGKVRFGTAMGSGALVGISLGKGVLMAWAKTLAVLVTQTSSYFMTKWEAFEAAGGFDVVAPVSWTGAYHQFFAYFDKFVSLVGKFYTWELETFVRSHTPGQKIEKFWVDLYHWSLGTHEDSSTGDSSIESWESWREDSIVTLRRLLLNTAVFLLAVSLGLNVFAKRYRHPASRAASTGQHGKSVPKVPAQSGGTPVRPSIAPVKRTISSPG